MSKEKKVPPKAPAKKTSKAKEIAAQPPAFAPANPIKKLVEAYYDDHSKDYWVRCPDGNYAKFTEGSLKRLLKIEGYSATTAESLPSEIDEIVCDIQMKKYVRYSGALAGYDAGLYKFHGKPVLVTESPVIKPATYGGNSFLLDFISRGFDEYEAQYVYAWIKLARESILSKSFRRLPVLVLVGDTDLGKSLLIKIINACLTGRWVNPKNVLDGYGFNQDCFECELQVMDDIGSDDTWKSRKLFSDGLKQLVADAAPKCHGKGQKALTLNPAWFVIIACNAELEDLQVLPPLNKGIGDKLVILKVKNRMIDAPTKTTAEFAAYKEKLELSIGDFLGALEHWEVPEELTHDRFGLRSYHNHEVVEALSEFAPQLKLLHLIDRATDLWPTGIEQLTVTSRDLETSLKNDSEVGREAMDLLRGSVSCGRYLNRLSIEKADRVQADGRVPGGSARYQLFRKGAM